jgi:hypothetical protein
VSAMLPESPKVHDDSRWQPTDELRCRLFSEPVICARHSLHYAVLWLHPVVPWCSAIIFSIIVFQIWFLVNALRIVRDVSGGVTE